MTSWGFATLRAPATRSRACARCKAGAGHAQTGRTTPAGVVRAGRWKLIEFFEDGSLALYDLEADVGEQHTLAEQLPEKTQELHQLLIEWRGEAQAPMPRPNPDYDPGLGPGSKGGRERLPRRESASAQ